MIAALNLMLVMTLPATATTGELGMVKQFAVSPNRERILFVSESFHGDESLGNGASIMLFDFRTMDVIGLTGKIREAVLSPDAKFIAYVENDHYYGNSLSLLTADGRERRVQYHKPLCRFSQLRWSADSIYGYRYLSFVHRRYEGVERTAVISPQYGVLPDDEVTAAEWQEPEQIPANHPLYRKKPTIRLDSSVLWGDDRTIYVQAVDGIWKGELDVSFIVQWTQLVAARDVRGLFSITTPGTHLMYSRPTTSTYMWASDIWVLPLEYGATPVKIGKGTEAQFTPDGQHILLVGVGLWMVSLDGSLHRKLTSQISEP